MTEQKEAAGEKPAAKIVATKARSKTVQLEWPIEFDGKIWSEITLRRVTGREVEQFITDLAGLEEGGRKPVIPVIDCPVEVYEALDDDDVYMLERETLPFLPRRLTEAGESTPETTDTTSEK
jgi:hypothetical protein